MSQRTCDQPGCEQAHRARGLCSTHYNRIIAGENRRHPKHIVACVICGTMVVRGRQTRYRPTCSVACRAIVQHGQHVAQASAYRWRTDAEQRVRDAGCAIIESFEREEIFERDGWLCQGCGIKCSAPDPFDKTAATVDHVVPLANYGEHSRANAQTLCLSCNSAKCDRVAA